MEDWFSNPCIFEIFRDDAKQDVLLLIDNISFIGYSKT